MIMAKTKWVLDPMHSELGFKIKHLMISNVSGAFTKFEAVAETEADNFSTATIRLKADMNSISTNNEQRDAHLRNGDFLDTEKYPEMEFVSTKIEKTGDDSFLLTGDLTMKGITKPVQLQIEHSGVTKDPWGNQRAGFTVTGKIKRSDWNVAFNAVLETGGVALSDDVRIFAEVQLVKEVPVAA
jgi:Uncharacterized conserved protein